MSRTPPPTEMASYRSPPIRAEAAAETYRTAMSTGGILRGTGRSRICCGGVRDRLEVREFAFPSGAGPRWRSRRRRSPRRWCSGRSRPGGWRRGHRRTPAARRRPGPVSRSGPSAAADGRSRRARDRGRARAGNPPRDRPARRAGPRRRRRRTAAPRGRRCADPAEWPGRRRTVAAVPAEPRRHLGALPLLPGASDGRSPPSGLSSRLPHDPSLLFPASDCEPLPGRPVRPERGRMPAAVKRAPGKGEAPDHARLRLGYGECAQVKRKSAES